MAIDRRKVQWRLRVWMYSVSSEGDRRLQRSYSGDLMDDFWESRGKKDPLMHDPYAENSAIRTNAWSFVYSAIDAIAIRTAAAAVTTLSIHWGRKRFSALDSERLEGWAATVTFRSSRVGSIFGVADTKNWGFTGSPLNANKWRWYPVDASRKILHDW